jgi:hypothetical protein
MDKRTLLLVATIIADLIVLGGFVAFGVYAVRAMNAKVRATTAAEAPDSSRPLLYLGAVLLWPLALALGMARMQKPETVRSARVLLSIALGHFAFATLAAIAIVTVVASNPPDVVLDLLPQP